MSCYISIPLDRVIIANTIINTMALKVTLLSVFDVPLLSKPYYLHNVTPSQIGKQVSEKCLIGRIFPTQASRKYS